MHGATVGIGAGEPRETAPGWLAGGRHDVDERGWSVLTNVSDHFGFAATTGIDGPRGPDPLPLEAGARLGDVTIVRLLGEGGMGRVYEGVQDGPRRRVAVKVLGPGGLSRTSLRRFEFEAEVLGRLRHPHIAQIHTVTQVTTPLGPVPCLVMELVENARTITEHAAADGLTVWQRTALVRCVAEAVSHGHAQGVIHRDLKPENILVDAAGTPKVIDFGVARPTDSSGSDATATGDVVGTLQYMSPEQLGSIPGGVDVRTDVYALGLVLHETLLGRPPHDLRGATPGEAARRLAEAHPPTAATIEAALRRTGHVGPGDPAALAVILARCLQTQPADRYPTAHDVAAELGRWLVGDPIEARPPNWSESARRFIRRHRRIALAAGVVLATLLVTVSVTSWFSIRALREWRLADGARVIAEAREREAAAQAATARRDLFRATMLLSAQARDHDSLAEARRALESARGLLPSVHAAEPIEFTCLEASLDDSVAVAAVTDAPITAIAMHRDGVAYGTEQGRCAIVPRAAGLDTVDVAGHTTAIWATTFSGGGRRVATASADGVVRVWDTGSGECVAELDGHGGAAYAVAFSPDDARLASAGRDGTILVHDTGSWETESRLIGHEGTVYALAFSPDGSTLASAGLDRILRLWDIPTARERVRLAHHEGRIFRVAFDTTGTLVATADEAGCARIVSAATGHTRAVLRHPQRVNGVAFVSTEEVVTVSADGLLRTWDAASGVERRRYRGHVGAIWDVAADADTMQVATAGADGTIRCWDISADAGPDIRLASEPAAVAWTDGGATFAVGGVDAAVRSFAAATLRAGGLRNVGRPVTAMAASADGDLLVAGDDAGGIEVWRRSADGLEIAAHPRRIHAVACTPDGGMIATASEDRTARLFDARSGAPAGPSLRHPRRVLGVALTPRGDRLATGCEDRTARIWSTGDGHEIARLSGHTGPVTCVALDSEGTSLLTGSTDATVRVWDATDGGCRMVLTGPTRSVSRVAWSPDGTRIAAASLDGTVRVWNAEDGTPTPVLDGGEAAIVDVAFAPDGRRLLTAAADRTVRVWGTSPSDIVRRRLEERE